MQHVREAELTAVREQRWSLTTLPLSSGVQKIVKEMSKSCRNFIKTQVVSIACRAVNGLGLVCSDEIPVVRVLFVAEPEMAEPTVTTSLS